MFGWLKRRERRDFTLTATDRATAAAFGNTDSPDVAATAAATAAAGIMGRAFAAAAVTPSVERTGLTPHALAEIGAAFITAGQSVWLIDVADGMVKLYRAASWDIEGDPFRQRYRLTISGPTRQVDRIVPAESVLHPRVNCSAAQPWRGRSPLELAGFSAKSLANAERSLSEELSGPVGRMIPSPTDQLSDEALDELEAKLAALKGRSALVPSFQKDQIGAPAQGGGTREWTSVRIGADPPSSVVELRRDGHSQMLAAAGVPPGLFESQEATGLRENLRQFLHVTVSPLARVLETEARAKLETAVGLDFTALHASDVQGRARAFKSMVDGGMSLADAAAASGILQPET